MPTAQAPDGTRLAYRRLGDPTAPPLLLLHGWAQAGSSWGSEVLDGLADHAHVLVPDLRGHGRSDAPEHGYDDAATWAADVDAVLADADVTTAPVLLGWSYGGLVACDWLSRGGRAAGLVLVGAITGIGRGNPGGRVGPAMRAALPDALSVDPAVAVPALTGVASAMTGEGARAQALLGESLATPPRVRAALFDRTTGHAETLAAYDGAALVLHGTADTVVDPRAGEHAATTIPGASASWWDGAGHAPFLEHPTRFVAEVAALVARAGTQAAG